VPPWEITVPIVIAAVGATITLGRHLQKQADHENEIKRLRGGSAAHARAPNTTTVDLETLKAQLEDCRTRLDTLAENYKAQAVGAPEIQSLRTQVQALHIQVEARHRARNTDSIRNGLAAVQVRVTELEDRMHKTEAALARHGEKFAALEANFDRLYTETFPAQNRLIDTRFDAAADARRTANEAIKRIEKKLDRLIDKLA
jgi:chromosome segregation ATPase